MCGLRDHPQNEKGARNMSQKLAGSVCIITGATAGIGKASAFALASEGANLILIARREHRLNELVETIQSAGGRAVATYAPHFFLLATPSP